MPIVARSTAIPLLDGWRLQSPGLGEPRPHFFGFIRRRVTFYLTHETVAKFVNQASDVTPVGIVRERNGRRSSSGDLVLRGRSGPVAVSVSVLFPLNATGASRSQSPPQSGSDDIARAATSVGILAVAKFRS